ncbi:MAG: S9 family peptidase [Alcanivoracaceae bacterium]|nr:S9 family peptidase [Alcanivoracaceae bacterium]
MYKYIILFLTIQANAQTYMSSSPMNKTNNIISQAPKAKKDIYKHIQHDDVRIDNYQWLRDDDRKNPEVIAYLEQENSYTDHILTEQKPLIDRLYNEIVARLPTKEQTVPSQIDDYWYYSRFANNTEYRIYARKKGDLSAKEEIMVDMNDRAKDMSYFQSNFQAISPNHKVLGFSEDTTGRRKYSLHFKNLTTGEMYADVIEETTGEIVWALDNKTFFYTKKHPVTLLPYRIYRHELGSSQEDALVYEEKDNTFYISIHASTSKKYVIINIGSTTSSEVCILDASNPSGEFRSFLPREPDHEYSIEELDDEFYILTNWQAKNFRIMKTDLAHSHDKKQWQEVIAHDENALLYDVQAFKNYLAIEQRSAGIRHINLYNLVSKKSSIIKSAENAYTMWLGFNPQQNTDILRYEYSSMTSPFSVYDYDMKSGQQKLMKEDEVIGTYESKNYKSQRLTLKARDGVQVPVSLVYKQSNVPLGLRPLLIYGYGSYGSSVDPTFSYSRISLLDRGFIFAIAHIRGSQANGRSWYEDGKLLKKKNTFTDFIDVTKGLVKQGYGDKAQVFAMGGSAGGLLMGAIVNMDGMLYKGVIAAVPFVDVISTMLDEDIPLTTGEFDEWGNPKDKKYYDYMLSYSPYDNVSKQDYPNMLVTTGLHDSQVQYWEPAKWVAKLREMKTNDNLLIMRTNMDAGHGGASGRYQRYKETAEEYGFILKLIDN